MAEGQTDENMAAKTVKIQFPRLLAMRQFNAEVMS